MPNRQSTVLTHRVTSFRHALFKSKPSMLQALINSWFSMANDPIPQAEHKFQEDVHRALAISAWGGEGQLLALSWLFNRPIFAYNSFYEGSQLSLGDTTNVTHLSQRFLNFERNKNPYAFL